MEIRDIKDSYQGYVQRLRRELHEQPELSYQEFETTKRIARELDDMGIPYEITDRNIENKVNALEEGVLLIGQEITNLKIKLSLRCHAEFKWICVTPLQVNDSVNSWECIRNHILGIWNHSDFSIDISKLHQDIQSMKQVESDFSSQWLSNFLF